MQASEERLLTLNSRWSHWGETGTPSTVFLPWFRH